ncbi:benzoate 1,2-dioxygenase electron transfer component BenC [Dietzia kunjamensis]|uniref:benzoate 1,2-dioxygenase electron transfer component BenC n=1 Tax=Dietzia kunjamensis TaxID=322509 RepID=UPI0024B9A790|nr:benzoate 1,2-dioxygenase electron transfer component BenC [Dietzia kunjamensis]MDJ0422093.1 benzoate 1,2-dioxygenase electron transfer component BenC [Dietzia kunjamensis]
MSYSVALAFEDGVTRFVNCGPMETVADASYKARINIPLDCRDGACGTCKSLCESGEFDGGDYIDDALTEDEAAAGYCLPCQMVPRSDLVVQIPTTSDVAKTAAAAHPATVTAVERLAEGAFALSVELDDRDALAFLPGQYVNIAVPGTDQTRSYSFSTGADSRHLSFLIKYASGGAMSEYLAQRCAVGDRLELTGPMGSFFLRESSRPLLLLAGGTGLAPVLSILETLAAAGTTDRPVHLIYGTSFDTDVVYTDLLDEFTTRIPGMTWDLVVADPATTHPNSGYVTGLIRPEHLHDGTTDIYLCGPPPMVEAVRGFLDDEGLQVTHFYYEKFTPATAVPDRSAESAAESAEPTEEAALVVDTSPSTPETEPAAPAAATTAPAAPHGPARIISRRPGDPVPAIEARPVGYTPPAPGGHTAPGTRTAEPVANIAARPVGFTPPTPGGHAAPADRATESPAPIAARPAGYVPPQVTLAPRSPAPTAGTTTTVSLAGGNRSETVTSAPGVVSGEVHPAIRHSDAQFDARMALELGVIELTMGRLDDARLAEFRMLAESANQYIEGDRFLDPERFTAANAQFHEFLFCCTGNDSLLQAYRMLEVTQVMNSVLPDARWVSEDIVPEHLEIVAAFETGDRDAARYLIRRHSEHAKATMRTALDQKAVEAAS